MEGTPPGDALPRATPARKGACCGAGAGSTRPHRPHPGHTGRGTLAARSRGRAACGAGAGSTASTPASHRTRDTRVAEPWLPAPEDGRPGEGQRLTPGAPHNGGKHPPPGTPFRHPQSEQCRPAGRVLWGRCWVHTPASTAPGTHGSRNPGCPLQRTSGRGRDSA